MGLGKFLIRGGRVPMIENYKREIYSNNGANFHRYFQSGTYSIGLISETCILDYESTFFLFFIYAYFHKGKTTSFGWV
jgi:hypothetical protein